MMRRARVNGFPVQFYTSGHSMPTPFCTSHYMNRFINCKKLVEIKYCNKDDDISMAKFEQRHRLPKKESINIVGTIRPMQKKDASTVLSLLKNHQKEYKFKYKFTQEDVIWYLMPRDDITWSYVIENEDENGKLVVTDFFSMNRLTQTCTDKSRSDHNHTHDAMSSGTGYYYGLSKNTLADVQK